MLFAITLLAMLLGAINYNLALGHALVFLLASLGITSMVHTYRNLLDLHINFQPAPPVFAGETALFTLDLHGARSRPGMTISTTESRLDFALPASGEQRLRLPVSSTQRGWLPMPDFSIKSLFPLGIFVAWSRLRPDCRSLVYPHPIHLPLPAPQSSSDGNSPKHSPGDSDFNGLRERQPADPLRHVAWKQAARHDDPHPLQVKHFSTGQQPELVLDWHLLPAGMDKEQRLSALTGWVLAADAAGCAYALHLPGRHIPKASGASHRQRCLEFLALAP